MATFYLTTLRRHVIVFASEHVKAIVIIGAAISSVCGGLQVELLKLKLDVGMQILCRSEADACRVQHMVAKQRKE